MEQKGEEKDIKPTVETDEEDEEEYQRNLKEVQAHRQYERAKENIWNEILQQNKAFEQHDNSWAHHDNTGSWAPHEQQDYYNLNPQRRLPNHIKTQWQRLTKLREI